VDPPTPEEGLRLPLTAPHDRDLLARAKVHPSIAQKILRHANIETTLAIYTHVDDIEDMRSAVAKLDFGPLEDRAPRQSSRSGNRRPLLPAASSPKR